MFSWIGGKYFAAKWIWKSTIEYHIENDELIIDGIKINTYAEPFTGAGWNYFKNDIYKYVNNVVFNDQNKFLVNSFTVVKDPVKRQQLLEELENMEPANNKEFERCRDYVFKKVANGYDFELGDVEVAKSYVYTQLHMFNGNKLTKNTKLTKTPDKRKLTAFIKKLKNESRSIKNFVEKVEKITSVNNKDYKEIIKEYDAEDTLFYLDPPYFDKEHFYAFNDFNKKEHYKLAEILKNIKGKFVLSYYWFDDLEKLYPLEEGYFYIAKQFTKNSSKNKDKSCEILITNFYPNNKIEIKKQRKRKTVKTVNNKTYKTKNVNNIKNKDNIVELDNVKININKIVESLRNVDNKTKTNEIITKKETVANNNNELKELFKELINTTKQIKNELDELKKDIREIKEVVNNIKNEEINNINNFKSVNNKNYKKDEVIEVKKVVNDVNFNNVVNNIKNIDEVNIFNNVLDVKDIEIANNINYTNTKIKYSVNLLKIINNVNYINNISIKKINNIVNNVKELGPPFLINYIV